MEKVDTPHKCKKCAFCNVFVVTNEKIDPVDGDECGVFGLAKCKDAYMKYCNGCCFAPLVRSINIQLSFDF